MKIEEIRRENLSLIIETRFGGNRSALAKAVGKADSQIYRIFNKGKNGRPLSSKAARSFELALGIDDGVLDQPIDNHSGRVEICNIGVAKQSQEFVPVISWMQAGQLKNHKLSEGEAPLEWVAKINGGNKVYALYVKGDSMTAPAGSPLSFPEGYIIHVDPQQEVVSGDCVIAMVKGHDRPTFKQYKSDDGRYLKPLNANYPIIFDDFEIIGKVIGASIKL